MNLQNTDANDSDNIKAINVINSNINHNPDAQVTYIRGYTDLTTSKFIIQLAILSAIAWFSPSTALFTLAVSADSIFSAVDFISVYIKKQTIGPIGTTKVSLEPVQTVETVQTVQTITTIESPSKDSIQIDTIQPPLIPVQTTISPTPSQKEIKYILNDIQSLYTLSLIDRYLVYGFLEISYRILNVILWNVGQVFSVSPTTTCSVFSTGHAFTTGCTFHYSTLCLLFVTVASVSSHYEHNSRKMSDP